MAHCPVCQSEIEITSQHHGTLYTCPLCSGVFFVDWSGQPEMASNEPPIEAPSYEASEAPLENESYQQQPEGEFTETPLEEITPPVEESAYDFSEPLGQVEVPQPMGSVEPDTADLSEIADFGNSDLGQAAFNYTLTIAGIDSSAIRAQVEEALSDSKFGWNVIQLMTQIKDGVLTITSVNAVKASILMQRMKYFPVKISWRQDVLSSTV